ncbi:MAG: hypothetical protein R3215_07685 [Halomonas sp.]|nr:hypothetical protein [Halomonas sp.]
MVQVTLGQVGMVECRQCGTLTRQATWSKRHTPDGWQTVPVEPTEDMAHKGRNAASILKKWAAMLAAAPRPGGGDD